MDSNKVRRLFYQHATAMAYVDVMKGNGDRDIGSAFHIGEGVFVTARHIVEQSEIIEIKVTEPVAIKTKEYFRDIP